MRGVDIAGNRIVRTGAGVAYGLSVIQGAAPFSTDPLAWSDITIRGNRIDVSAATGTGNLIGTGPAGILCQASRVRITGNRLSAVSDDVQLSNPGNQAGGPTMNHITVTDNGDHLGSGAPVNALNGVDPATLIAERNG